MTKEHLIDQLGFSEEELVSKESFKELNAARSEYYIGLVVKVGLTVAKAALEADRTTVTIRRAFKKKGIELKVVKKKVEEVIPTHVQKLINLAEGVTAEVMTPDFTTVRQPEKIFRMDNQGRRYYYKFDDEQKPIFLTSMTTLIQNTLPTPPQIFEWAINSFKDYKEYKAYMKDKAFYGTFLHLECSKVLMKHIYVIRDMKDNLQLYINENKLDNSFMDYLPDLKKDLMAFAKFVIDRKIKVISIEIVLASKDGYGGALDIVCEMYIGPTYMSGENVGLPKLGKDEKEEDFRAEAIVDIKSGRKGFFESSEIQLAGYRDMWNENFPERRKIKKLYNWAPQGYTTIPKYKLKDQSDCNSARKLPLLVELNRIMEEGKVLKATTVGGTINIDNDEYGDIETRDLVDIVMDNRDEL
jgi:hypothetical protein